MSEGVAFHVVIPARYASTRLPGKPLLEIAGRPMLHHVYQRARDSGAASVVVATDDARIENAARAFGAEVCLTSAAHQSGTERIAEALTRLRYDDEAIVVNVQGDEPLIAPAAIRATAAALANTPATSVATACCALRDDAAHRNPNVVKVIRDHAGLAIYFSRAPIPWPRETGADAPGAARHHLGVYAYRAGFVRQVTALPPCALERVEMLEQLRFLYYGYRVAVEEVAVPEGPGVDTAEDLERVRAILGPRSE